MTAPTIPEGYILAPINVTPEMTAAGENVGELYRLGKPEYMGQIYRAMIAAAPAIPLPAAPVQGWISVKDRLPELHQPVALLNTETWLNTGGDFNVNWHGAGYLSEFGNKYWSVIGERGGMTLDAVTHWCELPLPPTGDSND